MKRYKPLFFSLLLCTFTAFFGCNMNIAGATSETSNGRISASVYYENGTPAANASVFLRNQHYLRNPGDIGLEPVPDAQTNRRGEFWIDSVSQGNYYIEIRDSKFYSVLFTCAMNSSLEEIQLPPDTLKPPAFLHGQIEIDDIENKTVFVQIYGLERIVQADQTSGIFTFTDLPEAEYVIRVLPASTEHSTIEMSVQTTSSTVEEIESIFLPPLVVHTVTFMDNHAPIDSSSVIDGEYIEKPDDPVRDGLLFLGWYTDTLFRQSWNFENDQVKGNVTLYARWSDEEQTENSGKLGE
ncbi:hypothetical protein CHISP_0204 [Chitinispirillum alkaliphilum]|nr:hypothetical protein CHISP_0204 [Chitinispirillum alkaliphilum]